jgi:hypothetical protein
MLLILFFRICKILAVRILIEDLFSCEGVRSIGESDLPDP